VKFCIKKGHFHNLLFGKVSLNTQTTEQKENAPNRERAFCCVQLFLKLAILTEERSKTTLTNI